MFYESTCNSCHGAGTKTVSMAKFADVAILELNTQNKLFAIRAVRQLVLDNGLGYGLKDCKEFVEAIMAFDRALRGVVDE